MYPFLGITQCIMKKLIFATLSLFIAALTFAQDPIDTKAKGILDKLTAQTKSYSNITASFTSKMVNKAANLDLTQEGKIQLKGDKYNLTLDDFVVITDGSTTWTFSKEMNEVQIDNNEDIEDASSIKPSELFTLYESGFKFSYDKTATINGKTCDIIKLFPKEPQDKSYHTIVLAVDQKKTQVAQIKVLGKSGETYTYTVKSFEINTEVPESSFTFSKDKFPGVDVIDNR